jgi:hypothetical protein
MEDHQASVDRQAEALAPGPSASIRYRRSRKKMFQPK